MTDKCQIVAEMYAAFGRGDVPAILARLAPDVGWEDWADNHAQKAGVPWLKSLRGRDAVPQFFQLLSTYKFHRFDVKGVMGTGNYVVGLVSCKIELPNGGVFDDDEMHLFEFNGDGLVSRLRHFLDTAKAIAITKGA